MQAAPRPWHRRLLDLINDFEYLVSAFALLALVVLLTLSIYSRYISDISIAWSEEAARFMFVALIFASISYTARQHKHIRITLFIEKMLSKAGLRIMLTIGDLVWLVFNAVVLYAAYVVLIDLFEYPYNSPVLNVPMYYVYVLIPVFYITISFRVIQGMIARFHDQAFDDENVDKANGVSK